jgi:hypothetical protein
MKASLSMTLPGTRGVRRLEDATLFFPEEMPDIIAKTYGAFTDKGLRESSLGKIVEEPSLKDCHKMWFYSVLPSNDSP